MAGNRGQVPVTQINQIRSCIERALDVVDGYAVPCQWRGRRSMQTTAEPGLAIGISLRRQSLKSDEITISPEGR